MQDLIIGDLAKAPENKDKSYYFQTLCTKFFLMKILNLIYREYMPYYPPYYPFLNISNPNLNNHIPKCRIIKDKFNL